MARLAEPILGALLGVADQYKLRNEKRREEQADQRKLDRDLEYKTKAAEAEARLAKDQRADALFRNKEGLRAIAKHIGLPTDDASLAAAYELDLFKNVWSPFAKGQGQLPIEQLRSNDRQYAADQNLEGDKLRSDYMRYGYELGANARKYDSDQDLAGVKYGANARQAVGLDANAKRLEGVKYGSNSRLSGVLDANDKRLQGAKYASQGRTSVGLDANQARREGDKLRASTGERVAEIGAGAKRYSSDNSKAARIAAAGYQFKGQLSQAEARVKAAEIAHSAKVFVLEQKLEEARRHATSSGADTKSIEQAMKFYKDNYFAMDPELRDARLRMIEQALDSRLKQTIGRSEAPAGAQATPSAPGSPGTSRSPLLNQMQSDMAEFKKL